MATLNKGRSENRNAIWKTHSWLRKKPPNHRSSFSCVTLPICSRWANSSHSCLYPSLATYRFVDEFVETNFPDLKWSNSTEPQCNVQNVKIALTKERLECVLWLLIHRKLLRETDNLLSRNRRRKDLFRGDYSWFFLGAAKRILQKDFSKPTLMKFHFTNYESKKITFFY